MMDEERKVAAAEWADAIQPDTSPRLGGAVFEVLCRLSERDFARWKRARPVILHATTSFAGVLFRVHPCDGGEASETGGIRYHEFASALVVFEGDAEVWPEPELLGVVAHEFGHVILGHHLLTGRGQGNNEFEACAWAVRAGFRRETLALLTRWGEPEDTQHGEVLRRMDELSGLRARRKAPARAETCGGES